MGAVGHPLGLRVARGRVHGSLVENLKKYLKLIKLKNLFVVEKPGVPGPGRVDPPGPVGVVKGDPLRESENTGPFHTGLGSSRALTWDGERGMFSDFYI